MKRLESISNDKVLKRKVDYIIYNLGHYVEEKQHKTTILEIGPGLGECIYYLNTKKIYDIDVLDNNQDILNFVSKNYAVKNAIYLRDIKKIDKKLRNYDLIIMIQVLEHIPIRNLSYAINKLCNHLKPKGYLIVVVPNAGNPLGIVERYADLQHTIAFTEQSLKDLVQSLNLKNHSVEIKGYEIPTFEIVSILRKILQKLLHFFLLGIMIINGGIFFKTMTPNIMMIIKRK